MRLMKLIVPAFALGALIAVATPTVSADDAPTTTQPSGLGTVTIKVVDADGNAVTGAKVLLIKPHKKGDAEPATKRHEPVAHGETDAQGSVTLSGIPEGIYRATAVLKGTGRGAEKVTIGDDAASPVTITLKAKHAKASPESATSQPAQ